MNKLLLLTLLLIGSLNVNAEEVVKAGKAYIEKQLKDQGMSRSVGVK